MKLKTYNLKLKTNNAQALLELAIFGSFLLLLLGILITYGLSYNFQQQAQMEAFRKALELAAQPDSAGMPRGSASYTVIKDRHLPDPGNPFGVGGVQPVMASASVTRDSQAGATADDYEGLPKMIMDLQGKENGQFTNQEVSLAMAGIRHESVVTPGSYDEYLDFQQKYYLVYGSVSGWIEFSGDDKIEDEYEDHHQYDNLDLRIVDSCEGEIVDYNSAIRQARLIADQDFCRAQCELGRKPGDEINCNDACGYGIAVPWYIQGAWHNGSPYQFPSLFSFAGVYETGDAWEFPNIENLFVMPVTGKKVQGMGMQQDYTQQINTDYTMQKTEDAADISTTDNVDWNTTTTRTFLYNDHLDKSTGPNSGMASPGTNLQTDDYSTTRSEEESKTWQTEW